MSLPVEKAAGNVDRVPLRHVVYDLLIDKYLDESSATALAITDNCDGFSSVYTTSRERKGLVINHRSSFFTPTSWNQFIDKYINLDSIKVCNLNHLYWLPADLLVSTILQMPNLEDLSIKGTQVCTFRQVAKILKACPKVVKLDLTYTEKTIEEIWSGLKMEEISRDELLAGFQNLIRLKMSTVALDAKNDILNDPWYLIINILTWCRDCKELSVEITYAGELERDWLNVYEPSSEKNCDVECASWKIWSPKLMWLDSLESMVVINTGDRYIISRLLEVLCGRFFPYHLKEEDQTVLPLRCLWIQGFEVYPFRNSNRVLDPECLQSFNFGESGDEKMYKAELPNLENLSAMELMDFPDSLLPALSKLKFFCGIVDDEVAHQFSQIHPNLEHLGIEYSQMNFSTPPSDAVCRLQKLKSFTCNRHSISKDFIVAMTDAYPNLEFLRLTTWRYESETLPPDGNAVLSAFRFPHLTFLSLQNLQLLDGSALLPIIIGCPKLEMVHLESDSLDSSAFATNLEFFLQSATKLRDFRLRWDHKEDVYPATAFSILKTFLKKSDKLERLALIDATNVEVLDWKNPPEFAEFLVRFTAQMTHLTCCCLSLKQMDGNLIKKIKERVEEEVVTERPSLWFHLGRDIPNASDPGVPPIHYHQIVNPLSFTPPPFYTI